ncbi:hypothetical protein D3C80_1734000 [compost metagenome]
MTNMITVTNSANRYSHWSAVSGRPKGASGFISTMPCTPPVQASRCLYLSSCGMATPSANVASARYSPSSLSAGRPKA